MARQRKSAAAASKQTGPAARGGKQQPAAEGAPEGRVAQMRAVWKMTRENDPKLIPYVVGPAIAVLAIFVVVGVLIGQVILFPILGVILGLLAGTAIFGRRATGAIHVQLEGKPGAAA